MDSDNQRSCPCQEEETKKMVRREEFEEKTGRKRSWLPDEITMEILSRIPVKSIIRSRCVSKLWSSITQDHHFIRMHLAQPVKTPRITVKVRRSRNKIHIYSVENGKLVQHSILDDSRFYQTDRMEPSANGLITYHTPEQGAVICNPATRDFVTVRNPQPYDSTDSFNLGFHPPTGKYKLVRVCNTRKWRTAQQTCDVLTLGSLSVEKWRTIREMNFETVCSGACVVHGVMYRVVREEGHTAPVVLSLDLGSEDIGIAELPPSMRIDKHIPSLALDYVSLAELNGKLCCGYTDGSSTNDVYRIWLLPDSGWVEMLAIDLFSVIFRFDYLPTRMIWIDDGIVLLAHRDRLFCHDVLTGALIQVPDWKHNVLFQAMCAYVDSLVSVSGR